MIGILDICCRDDGFACRCDWIAFGIAASFRRFLCLFRHRICLIPEDQIDLCNITRAASLALLALKAGWTCFITLGPGQASPGCYSQDRPDWDRKCGKMKAYLYPPILATLTAQARLSTVDHHSRQRVSIVQRRESLYARYIGSHWLDKSPRYLTGLVSSCGSRGGRLLCLFLLVLRTKEGRLPIL